MTDPVQLNVRDMQIADLAEVLAIEQVVQPSPWSRLSFEESLVKQHICRVVTHQHDQNIGQKIVAYHVICPVMDEMHILNLVVAQQFQGQGLGHRLLHDIVEIANNSHQAKAVFLEVRKSNEVARNLYLQWQFKQIALRKKYYKTAGSEREDAMVLVKQLTKLTPAIRD